METSVQIVNKSVHPLPTYATSLSAGMDLRAHLPETSIVLQPMQRALIGTGIFIGLPEGFEAQVRPRSGLALKQGLTVLNSPGTIDADYRGEVGVILVNLGDAPIEISDGDRIAQLVVAPYCRVSWKAVGDLDATTRGSGGFGHSGL